MGKQQSCNNNDHHRHGASTILVSAISIVIISVMLVVLVNARDLCPGLITVMMDEQQPCNSDYHDASTILVEQ